MKAKDYAKIFNDNPSSDTILQVANGFLRECRDMVESRKAKTESAAIAILNEQELKWQALSRLAPGIQPDGFRELVKMAMPDAYQVWKRQ